MKGEARNAVDRRASTFVLLMGPDGKYFYRHGDRGWFFGGKTGGMIDFRSEPPKRSATKTPLADTADAVKSAGGPDFFARLRTAQGEAWLSLFGPEDDVSYKEEKADLGVRQITVSGPDKWHRFRFAVDKNWRLMSYAAGDAGGESSWFAEYRFAGVHFPSSVPDLAFLP
jgi:hypothetical protein